MLLEGSKYDCNVLIHPSSWQEYNAFLLCLWLIEWFSRWPGFRDLCTLLITTRFYDEFAEGFQCEDWGLFRRSLTYVASLWGRNTIDTHTLHRINTIRWAVAGGQNLSFFFFFACESREDNFFITFDKNFMVLNRVVTSPLVGNYRRPESRLANRWPRPRVN